MRNGEHVFLNYEKLICTLENAFYEKKKKETKKQHLRRAHWQTNKKKL